MAIHNLFKRSWIFLIGFGIVLALFGIGRLTLAQSPDFAGVEIKTIPVTEGIYMLVGEGGNIGVSAGEDGVFLIDDQFAPLTEKIQAAITAISKKPIRFLLNTHWHFDHTGGNENLGKAGVTIVAHDKVREYMSAEQFIEVLNMKIPASPPVALPIITFNDTVTFHLNGNTIKAFHVQPAHTDSDSVIYFDRADVIHTGDVYFRGMYPFLDVSHGGSIEGTIAVADRILEMAGEQTKIIPGHGSLSNRAELVAYRDMLIAVRDLVKSAIAKGMTVEEFIATNPTADLDSIWGKGLIQPKQFLQMVYSDLKQ